MEVIPMAEPVKDDGRAFKIVFDSRLYAQLEDWRRNQRKIPSVAASVRELVARQLASEHVVA
jgi:hypothetical protein